VTAAAALGRQASSSGECPTDGTSTSPYNNDRVPGGCIFSATSSNVLYNGGQGSDVLYNGGIAGEASISPVCRLDQSPPPNPPPPIQPPAPPLSFLPGDLNTNAVDCPLGHIGLDNTAEDVYECCVIAAAQVNTVPDGDGCKIDGTPSTYSVNWQPKGCIVNPSTNPNVLPLVYYNSHATGRAHTQWRPICRRINPPSPPPPKPPLPSPPPPSPLPEPPPPPPPISHECGCRIFSQGASHLSPILCIKRSADHSKWDCRPPSGGYSCGSDYSLCTRTPCEDTSGVWAIRKCYKKQRKGKCRKTRVRNNCKLTCGLC